jgi:GTP-binding protein EngB required for normal cell division
MSPLKMGTKRAVAASADDIRLRGAALGEALEAGAAELDPALAAQARRVVTRIGERTSIAGSHTVVALAGATGSGKSSLFNDLVGADVATVGARRPTTSTPTAAVWGPDPASALLDWLAVGARHHVDARTEPEGLGLDGLVLLDLPDFDSRQVEHRVEADRVLGLADVFVWVTDPQKYADARLHRDYLAALAGHDAVTLVVLNQADRLTPEAVAACRKDLGRLLQEDGLDIGEVLVTSARDGSGVVDLQHRVSVAVAGRTAAVQRLDGDVRSVAGRLRVGVADTEPRLDEHADAELVDALTRAAGLPVVLDAVQRDYRREAFAHTGWPFTRWVRRLRPDPLRRLRLGTTGGDGRRSADGITESDVRAVLGRSSLPPATPAARSAVELATRALGDRVGEQLPQRWSQSVADAATPHGDDLGDALDGAVTRTPLRTRKPLWWGVFNLLQWLLALAAVLGLAWLAVLAGMAWLRLPEPGTPRVGILPVPTLMLLGGLVLGLVLSALARPLARIGARRRRRVIARRLRDSVGVVARDLVVAPVQAVLDRHRRTRERLDTAAARRS